MINAILAFNRPLTDRETADGDTLSPVQWLPMDYSGDWARTTWREPKVANSKRSVFDVQVADEATIDTIAADFPDMVVIGAWERETGEQVRGIHSKALGIMPDIVERDEDGNVVSRSRPTELRDYHVWAGQATRDWSS